MFSITHKIENGFSITVLRDGESGCFAEIIPECGAILHSFGLRSDTREIQLIDHYQSKGEFENSLESLGYKSCKLSPFVCRMRNNQFSFEGKEYILDHPPSQKHALHGLLYNKSFTVIKEEIHDSGASVTMSYEYNHINSGFPFNYDCVVTYKLASGNQLSLKTECINKSTEPMPIQDGWHPYFDLGDKVDNIELSFQSSEQYIFDNELLPTGEKVPFTEFKKGKPIGNIHLDNSFVLNPDVSQPMCTLRNKNTGLELQIIPADSYPILQLYTPEHRQSIAIENLSGPPNAFNLGMGFITLNPGHKTTFETTYRIQLY